MSTDVQTETQRYIGQVKWFNNRAGYGFITMTDESGTEKDVFAHFSTIKMDQGQYKFLVQGEYVEFELSNSANESHEFQATNITGIKGGTLMCESRQQNRPQARLNGPPRNAPYNRYNGPRRDTRPRREPREPREHQELDGFERVEKKRSTRDPKKKPE